jgi:pathogenesis-related protein 1
MSKEVVDAWGGEMKDYTYAQNSCAAGKVCGHYTQVVWKNTTTIGCGMAICDNPKNQIWVCQYLPSGNWVGQKPY